MNDADNKSEIVTENDKKAEEGLGCFIARVSVLTVICAFVVLSLAAALIGCLFPKAYMDMYRGLGAYGKASDYAAAALMRESHSAECEESACAYMNLLESAVGIAVIAAEDGTEASYTRLYEFTDAYVSAPCRAKHSARVDATYIKEYGKNLAVLSVLYGYDGYVAGEVSQPLLIGVITAARLIKEGAFRIMGGGFTGTVLAILPERETAEYAAETGRIFGRENVHVARLRPFGACEISFD